MTQPIQPTDTTDDTAATDNASEASAGGRVTLEDVRAALGDTGLYSTNASKLRAILGRGGNSTIQRHLDTLRAEYRAAQTPVLPTDIPLPPQSAIAALWSVAYAMAQSSVLGTLTTLQSERGAMEQQIAGQQSEALGLAHELDIAQADASAARASVERANKAAVIELAAVRAEADNAAQAAAIELATVRAEVEKVREDAELAAQATAIELAAARIEVEKVKEDARHAEEVSRLGAQIAQQSCQATIDRLTDKIAELKTMRIDVAALTPVAPKQ